ncbi:hypothetical protein [Filimonas effusa]|uniref:Uncharacterized protein n=1 Tax=Filimonas effusa TaxID=2508721 RepID=A0A4Q1DAU2_9BACT|nr:hypothetical protein [Filimonas effusa]RXK85885.1 hypothetical protein ESB13_03485 [Filimonas effusa]
MLAKREEAFITWWEQNRDRNKRALRQLFVGLPVGVAFGAGILLSLGSGWYERANMVANSQVNPNVIIIAVAVIAVFIAVFYKKYQWEMYEQQYRELLQKKKNLLKKQEDAANPASE